MTSTIHGVGSLKGKIAKLPNNIEDAVNKAVFLAATDYEGKIKRALNTGSRSGRKYGDHIASAPGEFPKTDTGALVNSVEVRHNKRELTADIYSGLKEKDGSIRALNLELGTSKIEPRPMWEPILKENTERYKRMIGQQVKRILK